MLFRSRIDIPCKIIVPHPPPHSFERLLLAPAAGYRIETTGDLVYSGMGGYVYSASPLLAGSRSVSYLGFSAGSVGPLHFAGRASALSVRCVQASAPRLFPPVLRKDKTGRLP